MKVIAKIDSDTVLCEVSSAEIANLNGFRSTYESGCEIRKLTEVGATCNLQKMVTTSQFVRNIRNTSLAEAKKRIEISIREIDAAMEVVGGEELFAVLGDKQTI
jgi:hypothetical protein